MINTDVQTRPIAELPSALEEFDFLTSYYTKDRNLSFFLDYDGTLTPIVDRPELAVLSKEGRAVVNALGKKVPVAIISGRDRPDVEKLVGIDSLIYAGSHGFDIHLPDGGELPNEIAGDFTPMLDIVEARLHGALDGIKGALIERKKFSIAVHDRLVAEGEKHLVGGTARVILADTPGLKMTLGKCVFELQPKLDWNKGRCVLWLIGKLEQDSPRDRPIFCGDDITDEDAFKALYGRGLNIIVAKSDDTRETAADFRVSAPAELLELLRRLTPED